MRKFLNLFLFFILHSLVCNAQDTLVLRNGEKMGVKVVSVTNRITYSTPHDSNLLHIAGSKVSYIKYGDGSRYKLHPDTGNVELQPYILVSGGVALPIFDGYGGNDFRNSDEEEILSSGYAGNGLLFSVMGGIPFSPKWEITGMVSNIRNRFDATPVMNEANDFSIHQIGNISAVGNNYYYNNYSCLVGLTKSSAGKYGSFGYSVLIGELITRVPALQAHAETSINTYSGSQTFSNSSFNMDAETQYDFAVEIGIHCDVKITKHTFLRGMTDMLFSKLSPGGPFEVVNMTSGNTLFTGNCDIPAFFVTLFNTTIGMGYGF